MIVSLYLSDNFSSGLGHTGYDAPHNSLEERLLRRSIQRHANLYRSFGLSREHVRGCGIVYQTSILQNCDVHAHLQCSAQHVVPSHYE